MQQLEERVMEVETLLDATEKPGTKIESSIDDINESTLEYQIYERPSILVSVFVAFQHILMSLASSLSIAFILSDSLCIAFDDPLRTKLFCSTLFVCGICSILQTTFGVRLPVFQGPSSSFIVPLLALKNDIRWSCVNPGHNKISDLNSTTSNMNNTISSELLPYSVDERLQQLSGSLMIASMIEVIVGGSGLVGPLLKYIGPITVAPTISLIGISLIKVPIIYSRPQWGIAFGGFFLVVLFTLYMFHIRIPMPRLNCTKQRNSKPRFRFAVFQVLPILLSIIIMWVVSAILTITNVLSDDPSSITIRARTDSKLNIVHLTPWFSIPYPGQFGLPKINTAIIVGFSAATIASLIESVGDYFAAAKACQVPSPPDHAVTRGIFIEGIGGILSGLIGVGHATTSYSGNIAAISLSKTASRSVMVTAGVLLISISAIGKVGACFALIPDPALGGTLIILLGLLTSLGLSNLKYIDMNSNRNMIIIGTAIIVGLMIPEWIDQHPDFISTGKIEVDLILKVVLGTPMFLGGVLALILDNTVRGTLKERGMVAWRARLPVSSSQISDKQDIKLSMDEVYDVPVVQRLYKYCPGLSKLPLLPPKKTHEQDVESSHTRIEGNECCV